MYVQTTFPADKPTEEISDLTKRFFLSHKYKLLSESSSQLRFANGSYLMSLLAFDPLQWKSEVTVSFATAVSGKVEVTAGCWIQPFAQAVTDKERAAWQEFAKKFEDRILADSTEIDLEEAEINPPKKINWKTLGWGAAAGAAALFLYRSRKGKK